jgi:tetratricopeptide (TPR) repeat protein
MEQRRINSLLADLKDEDESIRDEATSRLWQLWFEQKGAYGLSLLTRAQELLDAGKIEAARKILTDLIESQPDFAEAWNRRAVLHYVEGSYRQAIADCQRVIDLVPYHFGALHGLGLSHAALGEYGLAIAAFRKVLAVQPHGLINQRLILECTARL